MIPRYQRILFWILAGGSLLMVLLLLRGCARDASRIAAQHDSSPIPAPSDIPDETVSVALANDADGSVSLDQQRIALPPEGPTRARALLEHVLMAYALPDSLHPLHEGDGVADVYFVPLPITNPAAAPQSTDAVGDTSFPYNTPSRATRDLGSQLAVIDLKSTFADAHPSGIEVEDLTLRSLIGTLHANFPQVAQVRFLVDGNTRATLAGHADLAHLYPVNETTRDPIHILAQDGSRM